MKKKKGIVIYSIISIIAIMLIKLKIDNNGSETIDKYIKGFLLLAIIVAVGVLYFKKNISNKTKVGLVLIGLVAFVSYPLYNNGYLLGSHDIHFHILRIDGLRNALENFQIPARVYSSLNNGYGYAIPMFYPDLFLYLPAILNLLKTSMDFSYKILVFLINMAAVFSMYTAIKKISKSTSAGIIGSFIYATATYRLVTIYTRAAIGETLALAFFPLVIWGLYELCVGDKKKWYIFAIGVSCVLQSHMLSLITTAIVCIVIFVYFIKNIIKEKRFLKIILSGIMIVLVNLWFIVPFLEGYKLDIYIKGATEGKNYGWTFDDHNVIPAELFNVFDDISSGRTSKSIYEGIHDEMNLSLGLLCSLGIIVCIIYIFKTKGDSNNDNKFIRILALLGITFVILSTSIIPWKELQDNFRIIKWISSAMQFAWRFLGPATVTITMATSMIIGKYIDSKYDSKKSFIENYKGVLGIGVTAMVVFVMIVAPYSKGGEYPVGIANPVPNGEYYLDGTDTSQFYENKYESSSSVVILHHEKDGSKIVLNYANYGGDGYIEVPLLYYPVYEAKDENGKKLDITIGNNNVVRINLSEKKSGTITVNYYEKPLYIFADIVSVVTLILFIVWRIKANRKQKKIGKSNKNSKKRKREAKVSAPSNLQTSK